MREQLTASQHTEIPHKLTGSTVQKSNTKQKKKKKELSQLSHKWLLTSANNSDRPNTIPVWSIWQGRERTVSMEMRCTHESTEDFSVF